MHVLYAGEWVRVMCGTVRIDEILSSYILSIGAFATRGLVGVGWMCGFRVGGLKVGCRHPVSQAVDGLWV